MRTARAIQAIASSLALVLAGCAPVRSTADPFAQAGATDRPTANARLHRVRFEVVCESCIITWSVAGRTTSVGAESPVWRHTVERYPAFPEAIRLGASGRVEYVRIYVNASLVASASRQPGVDGATLQVETVIPLPPEAPGPDSLGVEGGPQRTSGR